MQWKYNYVATSLPAALKKAASAASSFYKKMFFNKHIWHVTLCRLDNPV